MEKFILTIIGILIPTILIANSRRIDPLDPITGGNGGIDGGGNVPTIPSPPFPTAPVSSLSVWEDAIRNTLSANSLVHSQSLYNIFDAFGTYGDGDPYKFAYILATAWHESRLGELMNELFNGDRFTYFEDRYGHTTSTGRNLGNIYPGDGDKYRGRSHVQLTGRSNYQKYTDILGIDLISNPDLVLQPNVSADIIVHGMMNGTFTGVGLRRYISGNGNGFFAARAVVNGDKNRTVPGTIITYGTLIKRYADGLIAYYNSNIITA